MSCISNNTTIIFLILIVIIKPVTPTSSTYWNVILPTKIFLKECIEPTIFYRDESIHHPGKRVEAAGASGEKMGTTPEKYQEEADNIVLFHHSNLSKAYRWKHLRQTCETNDSNKISFIP